MYAIKKRIHKVLAAFLCACLLLSYNPAFGAIDTAYADAGDQPNLTNTYAPRGTNTTPSGDYTLDDVTPGSDIVNATEGASTVIEAKTFTSELVVQMTEGPLWGTKEQIVNYQNDHPEGYLVKAQATCSESNNPDDYTFTWKVYEGDSTKPIGEDDEDLAAYIEALLKTAGSDTRWVPDSGNVFEQSLNLSELFAKDTDGVFTDDQKYRFECEVTLKKGDFERTEKDETTLYTIDENQKPGYKLYRIENAEHDVVATCVDYKNNDPASGFLGSSKLYTGFPTEQYKNKVKQAYTEYIVYNPESKYVNNNLEQNVDTSYLGDQYMIGITSSLEELDGVKIPPTEGKYDLYFVIPDEWQNSDVNENSDNKWGYREGDTIDVLWLTQGASPDYRNVQTIPTKVVVDPVTGNLVAKITYNNPAEDSDVTPSCTGVTGTVVDAKGEYPNLPGFFSLRLSAKHTNPENPNFYYTVYTNIDVDDEDSEEGGSLAGAGKYFKAETAYVSITPWTTNNQRYELKELWFENLDTGKKINMLLDGTIETMPGLQLDAALSCVTIGGDLAQAPYAEYLVTAKFGNVEPFETVVPSGQYKWWNLNLSVAGDEDFVDGGEFHPSDEAVIRAYYEGTTADNSKVEQKFVEHHGNTPTEVSVVKGGQVNMDFIMHAGINETQWFKLKSVWSSYDGKEWVKSKTDYSLDIPAMNNVLYVRIVVEPSDAALQPELTYYDVYVKAKGELPEGCEIVQPAGGRGIIAVTDIAPDTPMMIQTKGTNEVMGGYYAKTAYVTEGWNTTYEWDLDPTNKKDTGLVSHEYNVRYTPDKIQGDITIEIEFVSTNPTPRTLHVSWGSNGVASLVGNTVLTSDPEDPYKGTATIGSGEPFTILMVPGAGHVVNEVTYWSVDDDGKATMAISKTKCSAEDIAGGVLNATMPNENLWVNVSFKWDSSLPVPNKPNTWGNRNLSVYVANKNLADDSATEYIWKSDKDILNGKTGVTVEDGAAKISVADYFQPDCFVNSVDDAITNLTLTQGESYVLNFMGKADGEQEQNVSQVLVVGYQVDDEGNKIANMMKLYDWDAATFMLDNSVWGTELFVDVIVYFANVDSENGETTNQPDKYAKVEIYDPDGILDETKLQPGYTIEVLPGGFVTITDIYDTPWTELTGITIDGTPLTEEEIQKVKETHRLELGPVPPGGYNIDIIGIALDPSDDPEQFYVYIEDPIDPSKDDNLFGTLAVAGVDGSWSKDKVTFGDPAEVPVIGAGANISSDPFTILVEPWEGATLKSVGFRLADEKANIYYLLGVKGDDGAEYNELLIGSRPNLQYKHCPESFELGKELNEKTIGLPWRVTGLKSDMYVLPTFDEGSGTVNPPVSDAETWSVKASILDGKGSLSMVYKSKGYGNQVNVPKNDADPVYIHVEPADGYILENVKIKRSTDNLLLDFWDWVTGKDAELENLAASVAVSGGNLTLSSINCNYEVFFEFKNTDPDKRDHDTIPINVFSDPTKGTVDPLGPVRALKTGSYQFAVDTKANADGYYYVVKKVNITAHFVAIADENREVTTVDVAEYSTTDNDGIFLIWQSSNFDRFLIDVSEVNSLAGMDSELTAVDVEVEYELSDSKVKPEPDSPNYKKTITIKANPSAGGVVSPLGTYTVYPYTVDGPTDWAKFLVVVSPVAGYALESLTVEREGATADVNEALAATYMAELSGQAASSTGCFSIEANPNNATINNETITLNFGKLSTSRSTYTIHMEVYEKNSGGGTVITTKDVTLPTNEYFSYTVNPSAANTGITVQDQYKVGNTRINVPRRDGVAENQQPSYLVDNNNMLIVKPTTINEQVVDRWITVTFDGEPDSSMPKADPIDSSKKKNIKVTVYGTNNSNTMLSITPRASMNNILASSNSHYVYNWWYDYTSEDVNQWARIYCVKVNGTVIYGNDPASEAYLATNGSFVFDQSRLTKTDNTLEIYTGIFENNKVPTKPTDPDGEIETGTDGGGVIIGGKSTSGAIPDWVVNSSNMSMAGMDDAERTTGEELVAAMRAMLNADSTDLEDEGDKEKNPDDINWEDNKDDDDKDRVKEYTVCPNPGKFINHVYLYNCSPIENGYRWLTPNEVFDANDPAQAAVLERFGDLASKKIVLEYKLMLDEGETFGFMYATFSSLPDDQIDDPTDPDNYSRLGKDNLMVEFTPTSHALAVANMFSPEALTPINELYKGSVAQDDTIAIRPNVVKNDDNSGYTIKYSTIPIQDDNKFTFLVGPLLPQDGDANAADKLYTINTSQLPTSVNVEAVTAGGGRIVSNADGDEEAADNTETQADPNLPEYWRFYKVSGTAKDLGITNDGEVKIQVPLKKLTAAEGNYPELPSLGDGNGGGGGGNGDTDDNTRNRFTLTARAGEGGSITPTTTTVAGAWYGEDNTSGSWRVAGGTTVAFTVKADDNYVLTSLTRNDIIDCLRNREFNASNNTVAFRVLSDTEITAGFTPKDDPDAVRTVTISLQGEHGTTSPAPGPHPVEKGKPYSITFVPDDGYVPYRIWVDGVESFVSPTLVGWTLPASWSDQTFRVEYALAGTTPSGLNYLVQTGQNTANDAAAGLVRTGDNPVAMACIVGVAALAAVGVWQMRRRKAQAARAAKYSVTRRR